MSALAISLVSFFGIFCAVSMAWESMSRRREQGRRLLARMGVEPVQTGEAAAPVAQRSARRMFAGLFSGGTPARPEWAEQWVVPAVLAGALAGGLGGHWFFISMKSAHLAWGTAIGGVLGAWMGWAACQHWRRTWWAREISHGLIDLLDLWILCLDAGMSFQSALARAAQDPELARPALRRELQLTHQEIMAGCPTDEALRHLVKRCRAATELSGLVSHIIQAEKLGGSISKTLQVYASSLQFNRYQDMKEEVQKIPAKLAFPLIFCILPCLLIVIGGPALLRLHDVLSRH